MFTGIIEEVGTVRTINKTTKQSRLTVSANLVLENLKIGDSIAVNGVCLTVINFDQKRFCVDVMNETIQRTAYLQLKVNSHVNLERAMQLNGRLGGHLVSGHVDGTGTIIQIKKDLNATRYTIQTTPVLLKYIVEKGSIAIDGISLTVVSVNESSFAVSLIPHTMQVTTIAYKKVNDLVNLENDLIAKYVEKWWFNNQSDEPKKQNLINKDFLKKHGF